MFKASKYQESIFEWSKNGNGNAAINAVAGSGKSRTIEEDTKYLPVSIAGRTVVCAFNKGIALEMEGRLNPNKDLGKPKVSTIHSLGYKPTRNLCNPRYTKTWLDDKKYYGIFEGICGVVDYDTAEPEEITAYNDLKESVISAVHFARVTLTDVSSTPAFDSMCDYYQVNPVPDLQSIVQQSLDKGSQMASYKIDFDDMLYLPVKAGATVDKYRRIYVDEAQDLSNVQRALLSMMMDTDSRLIAVGDPKQAINGFAGAAPDSFDQIINSFSAKELPLSICYRCPTSHLDMAREIVPYIGASETAIAGVINGNIKPVDIAKYVNPARNDLIICRYNAPLTSTAFSLLKAGIPVKIKGKGDIMKAMFGLAYAISKGKHTQWSDFGPKLEAYREAMAAKLEGKKNAEARVEALNDKVECLCIMHENALEQGVGSIDEFKKFLDNLFSDNSLGVVNLSTIHKAKGLEADHVTILGYDKLPGYRKSMSDWQIAQEDHCLYVALTRAKHTLNLVNSEDK